MTHAVVLINDTRATVVSHAAAAAFAGVKVQDSGAAVSVVEKLIVQVIVDAEPI